MRTCQMSQSWYGHKAIHSQAGNLPYQRDSNCQSRKSLSNDNGWTYYQKHAYCWRCKEAQWLVKYLNPQICRMGMTAFCCNTLILSRFRCSVVDSFWKWRVARSGQLRDSPNMCNEVNTNWYTVEAANKKFHYIQKPNSLMCLWYISTQDNKQICQSWFYQDMLVVEM